MGAIFDEGGEVAVALQCWRAHQGEGCAGERAKARAAYRGRVRCFVEALRSVASKRRWKGAGVA